MTAKKGLYTKDRIPTRPTTIPEGVREGGISEISSGGRGGGLKYKINIC